MTVEGNVISSIGPGLLVLLGVSIDDGAEQADWLADKVRALRVFPDADGRMNEPLGEAREVLCVSQFTLYGDVAPWQPALATWRRRAVSSRSRSMSASASGSAQSGVCSAPMMAVELVNDGPVTLMLESVAKT